MKEFSGRRQAGFLPGQGINPFPFRPSNNKDRVVENQKTSILHMYDTGPFALVGQNIGYVFAMIELRGKQIISNMSWICGSGLTRANIPQTSLNIDSGATIHFFSNEDLLQLVKTTKSMRIYCDRTTFNQAMVGCIRNKLKHLPLSRGRICIAKDGITNLLSMENLVKEGYRVTIDSNV